jgi:hypothetical protein
MYLITDIKGKILHQFDGCDEADDHVKTELAKDPNYLSTHILYYCQNMNWRYDED